MCESGCLSRRGLIVRCSNGSGCRYCGFLRLRNFNCRLAFGHFGKLSLLGLAIAVALIATTATATTTTASTLLTAIFRACFLARVLT